LKTSKKMGILSRNEKKRMFEKRGGGGSKCSQKFSRKLNWTNDSKVGIGGSGGNRKGRLLYPYQRHTRYGERQEHKHYERGTRRLKDQEKKGARRGRPARKKRRRRLNMIWGKGFTSWPLLKKGAPSQKKGGNGFGGPSARRKKSKTSIKGGVPTNGASEPVSRHSPEGRKR